jgi:uncharacterized protein (DUF1499 family)
LASRAWLLKSNVKVINGDVEIYLDAENNRLAMRSAYRLDYSNLGENAPRLKNLTTEFRFQGIAK